jgi:hypothetical protein
LNSYGPAETKITIDESFQSKCHFLEEAFLNSLSSALPYTQHSVPNEQYPGIKRYNIDTECGYMVFGWSNDDATYQYIEESDFK